MSDVCYNVQSKPLFHPLHGEVLPLKTSSTDDEARLHIGVSRFWGGRFQRTYFDVRVFKPSYSQVSPASCDRCHEDEKSEKYEDHFLYVEQASFTPLGFSASNDANRLRNVVVNLLLLLL